MGHCSRLLMCILAYALPILDHLGTRHETEVEMKWVSGNYTVFRYFTVYQTGKIKKKTNI